MSRNIAADLRSALIVLQTSLKYATSDKLHFLVYKRYPITKFILTIF